MLIVSVPKPSPRFAPDSLRLDVQILLVSELLRRMVVRGRENQVQTTVWQAEMISKGHTFILRQIL